MEIVLETYVPSSVFAAALFRLGILFHETARRLSELAKRLDKLLARNGRAAEDRRSLQQMSDRELHDIGLDREGSCFIGGASVLAGPEQLRGY